MDDMVTIIIENESDADQCAEAHVSENVAEEYQRYIGQALSRYCRWENGDEVTITCHNADDFYKLTALVDKAAMGDL